MIIVKEKVCKDCNQIFPFDFRWCPFCRKELTEAERKPIKFEWDVYTDGSASTDDITDDGTEYTYFFHGWDYL